MDLDLSSRRALVTGSTAGIGLAIAKALAQLGAEVAVNGRTGERIEQAIAILRREVPDGRFASAPGDVGTPGGRGEGDRGCSGHRYSGQQHRHLRTEAVFRVL